MMLISLFSTLRRVPSLETMSNKRLTLLVAGMGVVLLVFAIIFLISLLSGKKEVSKKNKLPHVTPTHKMIMELQKNLIDEMKGTSKQNKLMINLTIIFISVSIFGIIASLVGGKETIDFIKNVVSWLTNIGKPAAKVIIK